MRALALSLLLTGGFVAAASADESPPPSRVTYLLGGVVSGSYRLVVDLKNDRLSEAKPPPGVNGDGARVSAVDIPETARRALTPVEHDRFRALAAAVWRDGAARRDCLEFNMDAMVRLTITAGGVERRSEAPAQCLTPDADALLGTLLCAANPTTGCS